MHPKAISVEQLALETAKVVRQARRGAVIVRARGQAPLVLRPLVDDDLAEELLLTRPAFKRSIRQARRRLKAGEGIPLVEARRRLKA